MPINDILSFNGKTPIFFSWVLKLITVTENTHCNPKELALGKVKGMVIKYLKALCVNTNWTIVKAELCGHFS